MLAILSTFIGVCLDLSTTLKQRTKIKNNFISNCIVFSICLLLSIFGADNLINYGYKFIGYFTILYFIFILILYIKQKNTSNHIG